MTTRVVPLHTRAARRAVIAPDLDRYLDPANVDLMVTDQVQAVRVRVERGLEVFENRLRDALSAVRRWLVAGATLLLICAVAGYFSGQALVEGEATGLGPWLVASAGTGGALWALWLLLRAGLDLRRLHGVSGRFSRSDLDRLETSRELLDRGQSVLEEARALGAIPPAGE